MPTYAQILHVIWKTGQDFILYVTEYIDLASLLRSLIISSWKMSYMAFEKSCHKKAKNIFQLTLDESKNSSAIPEGHKLQINFKPL